MPRNAPSTPLSLEISAIAHATEDPSKVENAILFVVPDDLRGKAKFTRRYLEGHHGNEIITISTKLSDPERIRQIAIRLGQLLPSMDKRLLAQSLSKHVDGEGNLYLRFDKQQAIQGRLSSEQVDPIRLKFKFAATRNVEELISSFLKTAGLIT